MIPRILLFTFRIPLSKFLTWIIFRISQEKQQMIVCANLYTPLSEKENSVPIRYAFSESGEVKGRVHRKCSAVCFMLEKMKLNQVHRIKLQLQLLRCFYQKYTATSATISSERHYLE